MDNPRGLGIARVALTVQVTITADKLDALLRETDRHLGEQLAERVDAWVRERRLGYYPALDYLVDAGVVHAGEFEALRVLAANIRKRAKRDVQTRLWPVFSSVHIVRAQSLTFMLPHLTPGQTEARERLARHYFPNTVRMELVLASLDKLQRLEDVADISERKVVRNLRDAFEAVTVSAVRRLEG